VISQPDSPVLLLVRDNAELLGKKINDFCAHIARKKMLKTTVFFSYVGN
jgi:hypothetical protein